MTFWRKAPPPPWHDRLDRARRLIEQYHGDAATRRRIDDVERSLADSLDDQTRLREAISALDPARATAELKAALRARPDPTARDTPLIVTLRERHEGINDLQNRLELLEQQQELTLADL